MRSLLTLAFLFASLTLYADTPDYDNAAKYTTRLKEKNFIAIPIYATIPNKGSLGANDKQIFATHVRALYPNAKINSLVGGSADEVIKVDVKAGWQPFISNVQPPQKWAFVSVGWSPIALEDSDHTLRSGDYVILRPDGTLTRGTLRDPDRVPRPGDTMAAQATAMLSEVHWHRITKNKNKALDVLQELAKQFPDTPAGARARLMLESIDKGGDIDSSHVDNDAVPDSIFKPADTDTGDTHADHLLSVAKFALNLNPPQPGKAQIVLNGLLTQYPKSGQATKGRELLDKLMSQETKVPKDGR